MSKKIFSILALLLIFAGCSEKELTGEQLIKQAIAAHGGNHYDTLNTSFIFRDKNYSIDLNNGLYAYTLNWVNENDTSLAILNNEGYRSFTNGKSDSLSSKDSIVQANSLNSVQYFALLPYGLDQEAVQANFEGKTSINNQTYYLVHVGFRQEKGGTDYEDEFMFWINSSNYLVDYLAYNYQTNGGGVRFREAYNRRKIKKVIFQDYNNYKAPVGTALSDLDEQFQAGKLELLSKIELQFND